MSGRLGAGRENTRRDQQHSLAALSPCQRIYHVHFLLAARDSMAEISLVVVTCGVPVLQDLRRTKATLGGL